MSSFSDIFKNIKKPDNSKDLSKEIIYSKDIEKEWNKEISERNNSSSLELNKTNKKYTPFKINNKREINKIIFENESEDSRKQKVMKEKFSKDTLNYINPITISDDQPTAPNQQFYDALGKINDISNFKRMFKDSNNNLVIEVDLGEEDTQIQEKKYISKKMIKTVKKET
mmetsp:Transcript_6189/g.5314  ORF Transcript_6189/g.5314 Transcript_6189/m.5314 type:complete len:170 (-) Transcript_6189:34-543(-)